MVAGDVLSVASSTGVFADKHAAVGKTVNVTGLSLGGADVANYTLASSTASTTADITPANLTVSTSSVSKTYDGGTSAAGALVVTAGTLFAGDALNGGIFAFNDKNVGVGNKIVTVSGVTVNDGNAGNNYSLAVANNLTSTINAAPLTVTANAVSKTYDGTLTATGTGTAAALAGAGAGESVLSAGIQAFLDKNAGSGKTVRASGVTIKDSLNADVTANYSITYIDNTLSTINQANLSVSGAIAASRPYDGTSVANITGAVLSGTVFPNDVVSLQNATTGNFSDATAGTAKLVTMTASLTGADAVNYSLTQPTGLTADITAVSSNPTSSPSAAVVAAVQKTVTLVNSPVMSMPTQQVALISYLGAAPAPLPSATLAPVAATAPASASTADTSTSSTAQKAEAPVDAALAPSAAPVAPEATVAAAPTAPVKPATQPAAVAAKTVAAKAATASPKAAPAKQVTARTAAPVGRPVVAPIIPNTGLASRLTGVPPGLGLRPPMVHLPVPPAIKNFAAAVPDVVGQKYPLLAESKIVPKEPEHEIRSVREDEMAQSFDAVPSPHNPGRVTKGNQSKASIIYEETLELVNFLNLLTLKIVP
jgi:hypothetical protein